MKSNFKFLMILYFAITLLVSGFLLINTQEKLITKPVLGLKSAALSLKPASFITREKNYKPFEYSLLCFSVGALVLYAVFSFKRKH